MGWLLKEIHTKTTIEHEFLVMGCVVKQNIWNMCLIHILCRAQNMLQVAQTARLWITSQQLNEHMTERNKIKIPASLNSAFLTQRNPFRTFYSDVLWSVRDPTGRKQKKITKSNCREERE